MFGKTFRLPFRLLGIPLFLDITFLIILPIMAWMIGRNLLRYATFEGEVGFPIDNPERLTHGFFPYLLGLIAAILLFVSVVLHELGHALTARRYGVRTRSITLWILGGVAQLEEIPQQRGAEAVVAIAGPIVSVLLAVFFGLLAYLFPASWGAARLISFYLAQVNIVLAVFNLLPALPLDGGRILRSLLALRMPQLQATQVSAAIGKFIAIGLGLLGFISLNFWLILIAFFIYTASGAETEQAYVSRALKGIGVRDLMTRDVVAVPPDLTVGQLTQRMFAEHHLGFPVMTDSQVLGVVTINQLRGVSPETPIAEIMSREFPTIPEHASALDAFTTMSRHNFGRLIVTNGAGAMVGLVTKTDLMHAIQLRLLNMEQGQDRAFPAQPLPASPTQNEIDSIRS